MAEVVSSDAFRVVLHYLAPIVPTVYFLTAKTVSACLLQQPDKRPSLRWRRHLAIGLGLGSVTSIVGEGVLTIFQSFQEPQLRIPQDYIVYLALQFAVQTSFVLGILENKTPIWHPYLGAWLSTLAFEIPILVRVGLTNSPLQPRGVQTSTFALECSRVLLVLALSVASGCFVLKDRSKSVQLDDESEALLTDSQQSSITAVHESGSDGNDDEEDDDAGFDSDSEEPEQDKLLRKQQRQRLKASGNWFNYLIEYKIFIPMLWPSGERFIQFCLSLIGLTIIGERILNIMVPRQLGIVTNELTKMAGTGIVPWTAIGLWMLYAALGSRAGIRLIKAIAEIPVEQYTYKAVSTTAFRHIMGLSMDFHSEKNSGELIRAIDQGTNLSSLLDFVFFEVSPVFFDLVVAFVYVYILFDIYMSLIIGAVGVLYVWVGAKITVWNVEQRRKFNAAWRLESKVQNEAINNWHTVSHFNRGQYESGRYEKTMDDYTQAAWKYFLTYNLGGGAQSLVMVTGRLLATLLAVYRVSQGRAPIGNLITLTAYWSSIEGPLSIVSYSVRRITQMLTDSERLLQLLQTKPTITDGPEAQPLVVSHGEVIFRNVNFAYDIRKPILKDVDFVVKPGQTVALVGETGGGKSTILKLLYRYYDVGSGAISIDGQDVRGVTLDSLRDHFGMVPQDPSLFNISIMDNIRYARLDASDEEVHTACKAAAIHDKIMSFPDGYASMVGERGVKLSGGELQRVAIARAILRQPRIVLLDEATSMVDAETEALIQTAFKSLTKERTTFIVAHRLSTIQHADLILVIGDGGIVEHGTHEQLLRLDGKYVRLWSKQLSKQLAISNAVGEDLIRLDESSDPSDRDE